MPASLSDLTFTSLTLTYGRFMRLWAQALVLIGLALTASTVSASGTCEGPATAGCNLFLKVKLNHELKISKLKPGDVLTGMLARDVYSGERQVLPAGSQVSLPVDKLERRRRVANDHWPWVIQFFTPRHENFPIFRSAIVTTAAGTEVRLQVSTLTIDHEVEIHSRANSSKLSQTAAESAGASKPQAAPSKKTPPGPTVVLEAMALSPEPAAASAAPSRPVNLVAGTQGKIILLGGISASKSRPGDSFQARLVEPVWLDSKVVLPEGTVLEGTVVKRTPPRMLSRAGSIALAFTNLTLPGGTANRIAASVSSVEVDQRSHMKVDPEGKIRGERPGKVWMLVNVGVTGGIAKEVDDGLQLVMEAVVSTATDASTAGTARIAGICASALFLLTRHGRDVVLPKFTEMGITFDRPVSIPAP
ncbi:MAG: hypothetical protein WB952_03855 [Terriglobales bacterium]